MGRDHGTLEDALAGTGACGLEVDDVVRLVRHACHGIARAHDRRLLHNDIKPGNLFLNAESECLVGDFGAASLIPTGAALVAPGAVTPATTAPEVAATYGTGAATASVRSDVYSLGATAFWLLAARKPFEFPAAADFAARLAIVSAQTPPRLRDVAPHIPNYVASAVEQAMARDPADRYATVGDFAAALGQRPAVRRRWRRTDEHVGHVACWRGEPQSGGSTLVTCLEQGTRPTQVVITTRHLASNNRVAAGCTTSTMRAWPQRLRSVMRKLS
jgi:serine/threonine protein kinase